MVVWSVNLRHGMKFIPVYELHILWHNNKLLAKSGVVRLRQDPGLPDWAREMELNMRMVGCRMGREEGICVWETLCPPSRNWKKRCSDAFFLAADEKRVFPAHLQLFLLFFLNE